MTFTEFCRRRGCSPETLSVLMLGAHDRTASDFSALWVLREVGLERGQTTRYRIVGGNDRLPGALASRLADRIVFDIPKPDAVVGSTLILRVTAKLGGQSWSDERRVVIQDEIE